MFREMRRKKRERSKETGWALLESERRGVLAMNGENGYPYAIPIDFYFDRGKNRIYFHGGPEGYKADALRADEHVCFTVYGNETIKKEAWAPYVQSTVIFGRCHVLPPCGETRRVLKRFAMKYFPEERIAEEEIASSGDRVQVYEIIIDHMTTKEIHER